MVSKKPTAAGGKAHREAGSYKGRREEMKLDELTDVLYEVERGLAWVTINRPERYNAFRGRTVDELIACFKAAWADRGVGVIALTGAGDKAFCAGGDQKQRQETGNYGPTESGLFEVETFHRLIRDVPKPVIAVVNGAAIGGGHVLHVLCDLTIAADHARFGQAGPRVGSFDAGFGSAYLARILGDKRAREVWYLCRQYDAATMERWGLVNRVVPLSELKAEVRRWADEMLDKSPTALKVLKHSFNADSDAIAGIGALSFDSLDLFVRTEEAREGVSAFAEKRPPDFSRFR
jgi:naphthoate synthase